MNLRYLGAAQTAVCAGYFGLLLYGAAGARAEDGLRTSKLHAPRMVLVVPNVDTPVPVQVEMRASSNQRLVLELRGVPPEFSLSHGAARSTGTWWIPVSDLPKTTWRTTAMTRVKIEINIALLALQSSSSSSTPLVPGAGQRATSTNKLLDRARDLLAEGNVTQARRFLERAANGGLAEAAIVLAGTYEARQLIRLNARGLRPDPVAAHHWRERANALKAESESSGATIDKGRTTLVLAPAWLQPGGSGPEMVQKDEGRRPAARSPDPSGHELLEHGDRLLAQGQVAPARQYYRRAADAGHADAAMKLGATYDSHELARLGVRGLRPNQAEATRWYRRARDLGASLPGDRVMQLDR
jgi:hypothetical protein